MVTRAPSAVIIKDGLLEISLPDGRVAITDAIYLAAVQGQYWSLDEHGNPKARYPRVDYPLLSMSVHLKSIILGKRAERGFTISNKNGDRLDCRLCNLEHIPLSATGRMKGRQKRKEPGL